MNTKVCKNCEKEKPIEKFEISKNLHIRSKCKECRRDKNTGYADHRRELSKKVYVRNRDLIIRLKQGPCVACGGKFHYCQMDFDHRNPPKTARISRMKMSSVKKILEEVKKCDLVCANCHRDKTQTRMKKPPTKTDYKIKRFQEMVVLVNSLKHNRRCVDCKDSHPYWRLDFDHREESNKSSAVSSLKNARYNEERIMDEISKCDLVCVRCHRLRTWERNRAV